MNSYTKISVYDLKYTLESVPESEIKSVNLEPNAMCKVRLKETKEITELENFKIFGHLHTVFIDGVEMNLMHRSTRLDDPEHPLPSSSKIPDKVSESKSEPKKKRKDPTD